MAYTRTIEDKFWLLGENVYRQVIKWSSTEDPTFTYSCKFHSNHLYFWVPGLGKSLTNKIKEIHCTTDNAIDFATKIEPLLFPVFDRLREHARAFEEFLESRGLCYESDDYQSTKLLDSEGNLIMILED